MLSDIVVALLFLIPFLIPYLAIGKRYALSDVDRIVRSTYEKRWVENVNVNEAVVRRLDETIRTKFLIEIFAWPYFFLMNRAVHGLPEAVEAHPLRRANRLTITERAEADWFRNELKAAEKKAIEATLAARAEDERMFDRSVAPTKVERSILQAALAALLHGHSECEYTFTLSSGVYRVRVDRKP